MRSRKRPRSDVESGYDTLVLCHLANIGYRTGRKICWDAASQSIRDDVESQKQVNRQYRAPWHLHI
jgi:hypothetical protein